jgi:cytochrome c oxidase assembly protein subunit 11
MSNGDNERRDPWLPLKLVGVTAGMFAFSFSLVPLYDAFCEITGLGGRTNDTAVQVTEAPDESRTVMVEFVTTVNESAPWDFRPAVKRMEVVPGKMYDATFVAENLTGQQLVGQAIPSVTPGQAGSHFKKTECFCFNQQPFGPNERKDMPLRFLVDRDLPEYIDTITLSYTFFDMQTLASGD